MTAVPDSVLAALRQYDSPTVFNALERVSGLKSPGQTYAGPEVRCLLPELGSFVGYAFTSQVTCLDPDAPGLPWEDYYRGLRDAPRPSVAVMQDIGHPLGLGAAFGDGMANLHRALGCVGAVVEGTIRDLYGVRDAGLPIFARGLVPGHFRFVLQKLQVPVMVAGLMVQPGDLIVADVNGIVRVPPALAAAVAEEAARIRAAEAEIFRAYRAPGFDLERWYASRQKG